MAAGTKAYENPGIVQKAHVPYLLAVQRFAGTLVHCTRERDHCSQTTAAVSSDEEAVNININEGGTSIFLPQQRRA
jgi:hypothetical protein